MLDDKVFSFYQIKYIFEKSHIDLLSTRKKVFQLFTYTENSDKLTVIAIKRKYDITILKKSRVT